MDYKFIKYTPRYFDSLTTLLNDTFHIENYDKKGLVTWKYFDEYLNQQTITYLALNDANRVVGHYTNIPISIFYLNKTYRCMMCTDMCTDLYHRGKGLISHLSAKVYDEVRHEGYDFSIGFSNEEGVQVDSHANNYGYGIVGRFTRYFAILTYKKPTPYTLTRTRTTDMYHFSSSTYLRIKKDREYLTWRYLKKPYSEYDLYTINYHQNVIGYVVLRFFKYTCYVYDIISQNDDHTHVTHILRAIEHKALQHRIHVVIYNVLDNTYWSTLFHTNSYFKKPKSTTNYYLTVKIHHETIPKSILLNREHWLLMNGDIL